MSDARVINSVLHKKLSALKRDGVSVNEAVKWLSESDVLSESKEARKRLWALLREGKIKGAYQFPNKRWVIVNRSRLPDGIQRVVPIKEAAESLQISERTLRRFTQDGHLKPLKFGSSILLYFEEDLKRFRQKHVDRSYDHLFPPEAKNVRADVDKLKRQLYYLRSDIRLIVERIEELIKLLE